MDKEYIINECGIEIGISNIIQKISKKIDECLENDSEENRSELAKLLEDREKIYSFDKETIKKYINI